MCRREHRVASKKPNGKRHKHGYAFWSSGPGSSKPVLPNAGLVKFFISILIQQPAQVSKENCDSLSGFQHCNAGTLAESRSHIQKQTGMDSHLLIHD